MREEMASTAEANGRSRDIASAMVDDELELEYHLTISGDTLTAKDIKGFAEYKLITLSTQHAVMLGIADEELNSLDEVIEYLDLPNADDLKPVACVQIPTDKLPHTVEQENAPIAIDGK